MRRRVRLAIVLGLSALAVAPTARTADLKEKLLEGVPEAQRLLFVVTEEDEVRAGQRVAANLLGVAPLVKDAELQRYVNEVGRWVASQGERPDLPWRFGIVESADVNAFAGPGGYVLVTRGLYASLGSESELAGVLAHEIAHVIRRHHIDLMRKEMLIAEGSRALQEQLGSDKDAWIENLLGNGAEMFARRLDREAEFEADRMAVVLAVRAGYDAYGLPAVLQRIGTVSESDDRVALLFKTHPHPDARLQRLAAAMGEQLLRFSRPQAGGRLYPLD